MDVYHVEPLIPPEVWEHIFRFCPVRELKVLRLVCHRWNGVVFGCPALRQKLSVYFENQTFEKGSASNVLPPAAIAYFDRCPIRSADPSWWSNFGRILTQLTLDKCQIGTAQMFRMLRCCPLLKEFTLREVNVLDDQLEAVDFKLDAMAKLIVERVAHYDDGFTILNWFRQIFPRLTCFWLINPYLRFWDKLDASMVIQLMESVKETLQELDLVLDGRVLKRLGEVGLRQLKQAVYEIDCRSSDWDINLWTSFCQSQPSLVEMDLWGRGISDEVLKVLVINMPNLKEISTDLVSPPHGFTSFLSHLVNVENVYIRLDYHALAFSAPFSRSLTKLTLFKAYIVEGITFLMNSTHLQQLFLVGCYLNVCRIPTAVQTFSNLKHLQLTDCKLSQKLIDYLVRCHPLLETVEFYGIESIRIDTVAALLLLSPKLHKIKLVNCAHFAANATGEQIMRHYHRVCGTAEGSRNVCFRFG